MRHRAPRPFVDLFHRVSRVTAHRVGEAADRLPIRALGVLVVLLGIGMGGYVTLASVTDGDATRAIDPATPTTAGDAERPRLNPQTPGSADPESERSRPEPGTSAPGTPETPSSPSDEAPPTSQSTEPDLETDSPSTAPGTSPTSPSQSGATPRERVDNRPPNTSLSEEYPEPDAARFSFSATETASFTCSLDGGAYSPCDSPTLYSDLESGWHTFAVRATDAAGNEDPSPAETRWHAEGGGSADE